MQQEFLINKAIESNYDHLTQFFIKYFHEGVVSQFTNKNSIIIMQFVYLQSLSIGGKLVSEFLGGNPSPLNFLIAGGFIDQVRVIFFTMGRMTHSSLENPSALVHISQCFMNNYHLVWGLASPLPFPTHNVSLLILSNPAMGCFILKIIFHAFCSDFACLVGFQQ